MPRMTKPQARAEAKRLAGQYAELMFPDTREIDAMTEDEREERAHRAYVTAARLAELGHPAPPLRLTGQGHETSNDDLSLDSGDPVLDPGDPPTGGGRLHAERSREARSRARLHPLRRHVDLDREEWAMTETGRGGDDRSAHDHQVA